MLRGKVPRNNNVRPNSFGTSQRRHLLDAMQENVGNE